MDSNANNQEFVATHDDESEELHEHLEIWLAKHSCLEN